MKSRGQGRSGEGRSGEDREGQRHLEGHVVAAGGEQHAGRVPFDRVHLVLRV